MVFCRYLWGRTSARPPNHFCSSELVHVRRQLLQDLCRENRRHLHDRLWRCAAPHHAARSQAHLWPDLCGVCLLWRDEPVAGDTTSMMAFSPAVEAFFLSSVERSRTAPANWTTAAGL